MSKRKLRIAIDLMGSDSAPDALLGAAASLSSSLPTQVEIIAIGKPDWEKNARSQGLSFLAAEEAIEMGESPLSALRRKKNSSLTTGLQLLKKGKVGAFVSAGNTGALVVASKMILGTFEGISRPALVALMPTKKKPVAILDVGANVKANAAQLVQFARLGVAYQRARGVENPKIGILNIGSEPSKGTDEIRLAYKELSHLPSFLGNIEGKSVFDGEVDVLITDGFTGNIFLKTAEGIASLFLDRLHAHTKEASHPYLDDFKRQLHYADHPGALLGGVKGAVIKCHGYSSPDAFAKGIRGAIEFASAGFIEILEAVLKKNFESSL